MQDISKHTSCGTLSMAPTYSNEVVTLCYLSQPRTSFIYWNSSSLGMQNLHIVYRDGT
nr:hypothetical protein Iba_chr11cCG5600 [Ipomoea batatas]